MTAIVDLDGVTFAYGDTVAVSDVSLTVEAGDFLGLVGPNGSGKTTLLRIVAGLLAPTGGHVERPGVERPVGYLPQHPAFRPTFTVEETLGFYADLLAGDADVEAALDAVGLLAARDRRVAALSGGMVRLLGLAQATLGDPPLVVLDEPTSDLDPRLTAHIADAVADRAAGGTAVLLASHDLDAATAADRMLVLDRGAIVAGGTAEELLEVTDAGSLSAAFLSLVGDEPGVRTGVEP